MATTVPYLVQLGAYAMARTQDVNQIPLGVTNHSRAPIVGQLLVSPDHLHIVFSQKSRCCGKIVGFEHKRLPTEHIQMIGRHGSIDLPMLRCSLRNQFQSQAIAFDHRLQTEALDAERREILRLRDSGEIPDEIYRKIQYDLDLADERLS